jgi:hypothetical protein
MGFEVKYIFHPRKDEGGYDTDQKEEKTVKVGKPFDDTPLEKCAAAIMAQLARRDIWVTDVEVSELIKKPISFKECKDGKGITLKGKRFSFNEAAEMISEDIIEEEIISHPTLQPHEIVAMQNQQSQKGIEDLYSNPNKAVPVQKSLSTPVNQNKVIYKVLFDPPIQYINEVKRLGLRLSPDKEYSVHQVIQHPTGKLELQKIAITDDVGRAITVDEKFFTIVGTGLLADKQLNFSGSTGGSYKRPKLAFEDQMVMETKDPRSAPQINKDIPIDDGNVPEDFMAVPDIRAGRR